MSGPGRVAGPPVAALALAAALALLVALTACGVKAPPRPPGAPEKAPPQDVLQPARGGHP